MTENPLDGRGLFVEVTKDRWDAYGAPTRRNKMLYKLLHAKGGVNESVTPGTYVFDVKRTGVKLFMSLLPFKE